MSARVFLKFATVSLVSLVGSKSPMLKMHKAQSHELAHAMERASGRGFIRAPGMRRETS